MYTDALFEIEDNAEKTLKLLSPEERDFFRYIIAGRRPREVSPERFILLLPFVLREEHIESVRQMIREEDPEGVLVRNPEELGMLQSQGFTGKIISDYSLYTFNRFSREAYRAAGVSEDTVSPELSFREIKERGAEGSAVIIYGRTPLMISKQCVYRNAIKCERKKQGFITELKDRKNVVFPVYCDCRYCHNIIYNSVPLSLISKPELIEEINPSGVRVDITVEDPGRGAQILRAVIEGREDILNRDGYTYGHFRKGVE